MFLILEPVTLTRESIPRSVTSSVSMTTPSGSLPPLRDVSPRQPMGARDGLRGECDLEYDWSSDSQS